MNVQIEPTWKEQLVGEFDKPYFAQLTERVRQEYLAGICYPPGRLIPVHSGSAENTVGDDILPRIQPDGRYPPTLEIRAHDSRGDQFSITDSLVILPVVVRLPLFELRAEFIHQTRDSLIHGMEKVGKKPGHDTLMIVDQRPEDIRTGSTVTAAVFCKYLLQEIGCLSHG